MTRNVSRRIRWARSVTVGVVALAVVASAACSSDDSESGDSSSGNGESEEVTSSPDLPAVDAGSVVLGDLPAGAGVSQSTAVTDASATAEPGVADRRLADDYVEHEYLMEGVASTYTGPATGPVTVASESVPYVTRILVREPEEADEFSGRVVVEPFNTTGAQDLDAIWSQVAPLLQANGDAWVGVTVRYLSDAALEEFDPARYGVIDISTNDVGWDMVRQVGALLKQGGEASPLPELEPSHVYLVGYSQSGTDTATFANAFHPITGTESGEPVFDGYFPAAHASNLTQVASGAISLPAFEQHPISAVGVPVVDLETQSDVEGFAVNTGLGIDYTSPGGATVRREDSDTDGDRFRLHELPGAPHSRRNRACDGNGSTYPNSFFVQAALASLFRWAEDGEAPSEAERITLAVDDVVSTSAVDEDGNALGGVRSPFVDLALVRYGIATGPGPLCKLAGIEEPLDPAMLRERYGTVDEYMDRFAEQLDDTIEAGFLLEGDREALLQLQQDKATAALG